MPKAIDEEKLASLKVLDIANPPTMDIPYQEFPKMVYLHPKDKTREHLYKIVASRTEFDAAVKEGWRKEPHVPTAAPFTTPDSTEWDIEPRGRK